METIQETLDHLPHEPGVYIYRDKNGLVIYVGKAIDLSRRVKQYFQRDDAVGEKTKRLVSEISAIETIRVTSEFDALLLEAKLIRQYMPKYNVIAKDDKSPLYVGFSLSEELPRVHFLRKGQLEAFLSPKENCIFGPFQSSHALKSLLRQVRAAVPYCTQKERRGKPCFYTHLGLCSPCPAVIAPMPPSENRKRLVLSYRRSLNRLKALFEGKFSVIRREYEKEMHRQARLLHFEEAAAIKSRLDALYAISEHRYDPAVFLEQGVEAVYDEELSELKTILLPFYPALSSVERIECFDMSQLFGVAAVGSMVVLKSGKPEPSSYRRFRIRSVGTVSDISMMREVLTRRVRHAGWPKPDFILIDGGKPQLSIAREVFAQAGWTTPFAGLAKRYEELILPTGDNRTWTVLRLPLSGKAIKVLQRVRDEAHRFGITYHRFLRNKATGLN